jgi:DNA repair protein RadC
MTSVKNKSGIKSWPEDDRPREKLLKKGAEGVEQF